MMNKLHRTFFDALFAYKKTVFVISSCIFVGLALTALRTHLNEDISDFLPLNERQKQAMAAYEKVANGQQIVVIFKEGNKEEKTNAVDHFASILLKTDSTLSEHLTYRSKADFYIPTLLWIYKNIPYFLLDDDYTRMDSLLTTKNFIVDKIRENRNRLLFPVPPMVKNMMGYDPLGLFNNVLESFFSHFNSQYILPDENGYIFSRDRKIAIALINSPFGMKETQKNATLIHTLNQVIKKTNLQVPAVKISLVGAPIIAMDNAQRLKQDTILTLLLASILIIIGLFVFFKNNGTFILYIILTVSFGYITAIALTGLIFQRLSAIVLGIGAIMIGIAINYPLHILVQHHYTQNPQQTLSEVIKPLITGNITTIGAFLTLIPLNAPALRQLGTFASFFLIATLAFSIFVLPLLLKKNSIISDTLSSPKQKKHALSSKIRISASIALFLVSVAFLFLGHDTVFDSDIRKLNFISQQQKEDLQLLSSFSHTHPNTTDIFLIQDIDSAHPVSVDQANVFSPYRWFPNEHEQKKRILHWNHFWQNKHKDMLQHLQIHAADIGFSPLAFHPFTDLIQHSFIPQPFTYFEPLSCSFFKDYWILSNQKIRLITKINIDTSLITPTKNEIQAQLCQTDILFDIHSLNSELVASLSQNFNYISWICSILVFVLLWISFKSIKLAVIAFIPMIVSWIWILGLMKILNLHFNIVNIILATLIFGQGDDYSIFVVEGIANQQMSGKPLLKQFRNATILSASLLIIALGSLTLAKHPALHSLGTTALLGMAIVVILANIIPPLLLNNKLKK